MKKILGAGPAGLCAAINLARCGEDVTVYERNQDVGMRFCPNLQGLKYVDEPGAFFKSLGVRSKPKLQYFSKCFFGTRNRDIELSIGPHKMMAFVERGGKESLEYDLYREAQEQGVKFEFSSRAREEEANVIATGGSGCDFAALGAIYEDSDFPRDYFLAIFDDRYSPKGWYSYIFPIGSDCVEFVNCASQPHVHLLAKLTKKALAERKILGEYLAGKRKVDSFAGSGFVKQPKSAVKDGRLYVGEAAGFQDPFMGFGIAYALKSGKCAAEALLGRGDYDALWKRELLPGLRKDFARRFAMSLFGDTLPALVMGKYRDGDVVDVSRAAPERFPLYEQVEGLLYRMECLKKSLAGNW